MAVNRGDHVAVVGLNGAGKSTLLKGIACLLPALTGLVKYGFGVDVAFFAQHVVEDLNPGDTVYKALERAAHRDVLPQEVKDLAGSLLFSGEDITKPISVLSGGEKSRVALGRILLKKASCLILDEPTNHLDFQTVEALTRSLKAYEGTIVVVSHDRGFIGRIGTKILEVNDGAVRLYPGTYDEYVWSLEKDMEEQEGRVAQGPQGQAGLPSKNALAWEQKKEVERGLRACERKLKDNETQMARLHAEIAEINENLSRMEAPSADLIAQMSQKGRRLNELEGEWPRLAEERERLVGMLGKVS